MKKHRILALSDFGTSGISESIRLPLLHLHDQGHEIWHMALGYNGHRYAVDEKMYPWADRLIGIPSYDPSERFGQRLIGQALESSKADILLTAFDVWMVQYIAQPETMAYLGEATQRALSHEHRKFTHIAYFPIDGGVEGKYLPPGMEETIAGFDVPVTYSRFAQEVVKRDTNIDISFIPIAHDPAIYYPRSKAECRDEMKLPIDSFIVGMVATNQYRKNFGEFFEAVTPLALKHDDVHVMPWTTWGQKILGGTEIPDLVYRSGFQDRVVNPQDVIGRLSDEGMSKLYNTFDVCVLTTIGEGCGLPPLRARACGVPALVSAHTSNTEFCGHSFEKLPVRGHFLDPFGSNIERYHTDVQVLRERLETLYERHGRGEDLYNQIATAGIKEMRKYEKAAVMPMWDKLLEEYC